MKIRSIILLVTLLAMSTSWTVPANAFYPYSKKAGDSYKNLPDVKKGGTLYTHTFGNPRTLIPVLVSEVESDNIIQLVYAKLMAYDYDTNEYFPSLAEKMEISPDYKDITFTIRKDATWEDGTPITSDDAEFTYKTMQDPKVDAAPMRSNLAGYHFAKIDQTKFHFLIDTPEINSLPKIIDDFKLLQKKQFVNEPDFNKSKGVFAPVGSGPYRMKSYSRDQKIELERNKNWWGWKLPQFKNIHNFDSIVFRVISDYSLAYEKLVKGEIDVMELTAEFYGSRVRGVDKDKFGTKPNSGKEMWADFHRTNIPPKFTYLGWNVRKPLFQSKKTRQALAQLVDYDEILSKVFQGVAQRAVSQFGSYTQNCSPEMRAKAFKFNVAKAIALLKEDGWSDADGDGVISKVIDGKKTKFEFTLQYNSENMMRAKMAQMVKEQFKKAGIVVNVQALEWSVYTAGLANHDFDAFIMAWGKGWVHPAPRQIWSSKSYENKGSNYGGYNNPEVDKLIDQADAELNPQKRFKIMQKMGGIIYDDQPYVFIGEVPGYMAAYHSKLHAAKWFMKYDDSPAYWLFSAE